MSVSPALLHAEEDSQEAVEGFFERGESCGQTWQCDKGEHCLRDHCQPRDKAHRCYSDFDCGYIVNTCHSDGVCRPT